MSLGGSKRRAASKHASQVKAKSNQDCSTILDQRVIIVHT